MRRLNWPDVGLSVSETNNTVARQQASRAVEALRTTPVAWTPIPDQFTVNQTSSKVISARAEHFPVARFLVWVRERRSNSPLNPYRTGKIQWRVLAVDCNCQYTLAPLVMV